jgi:hypothetical protein
VVEGVLLVLLVLLVPLVLLLVLVLLVLLVVFVLLVVLVVLVLLLVVLVVLVVLAAAWFTVKVLPPMLMVPVLLAPEEFWATLYPIRSRLKIDLLIELTVIQEALLVADQPVWLVTVALTELVPPELGKEEEVGEMEVTGEVVGVGAGAGAAVTVTVLEVLLDPPEFLTVRATV